MTQPNPHNELLIYLLTNQIDKLEIWALNMMIKRVDDLDYMPSKIDDMPYMNIDQAAIHIICENKKYEGDYDIICTVLRLLIENGCDINLKDTKNNMTALDYCKKYNRTKAIEYLKKYGAL